MSTYLLLVTLNSQVHFQNTQENIIEILLLKEFDGAEERFFFVFQISVFFSIDNTVGVLK